MRSLSLLSQIREVILYFFLLCSFQRTTDQDGPSVDCAMEGICDRPIRNIYVTITTCLFQRVIFGNSHLNPLLRGVPEGRGVLHSLKTKQCKQFA